MPYLTTNNDLQLFFRDWGQGLPVVFSAGWTLSSDMWRGEMVSLVDAGHRCVAYDRRGHGRSDDPGGGYDYDTLADDLAAVLEALDLRDVCLVGHSMAQGEIVRYLTRHGSDRIARVVFVAPAPPKVLADDSNPDGIDAALIDAVRELWRKDFPGWCAASADAYFATQVTTNAVSAELVSWTIGDMLGASLQAALECNRSLVSADWRDELTHIAVPTLYLHGHLDASFPIDMSSRKAVKLVPGARLIEYPDAGHGLYVTHREQVSRDILAFCS